MNNMMNIILMASQGGEGGGMSTILMLVLMVVVFYFFMIRPQQKKAKEQKKFRESLVKGSKVVTIGGIHGKIAEVKDTTVIIDVQGGAQLKVEKSAIASEFEEPKS
jgi:preprotein translocase subunit YajC